jgi:hypothetical protein
MRRVPCRINFTLGPVKCNYYLNIIIAFSDMMPCCLANMCPRFGGTWFLKFKVDYTASQSKTQ